MSKQTILQTLAAIQQELKAPKNLRNNFGEYNYRSAESILNAVKPLLGKHGAVINISDELIFLGDRYYIKATATIETESGEKSATAYAREEERSKGFDAAQITGAASSYARKYALNGLLAIDDTKDPDSTNTHGKSGSTSKAEETKEELPWIKLNQVNASISRIENGEEGVIDKILASFRVSKANMEKLKAAKVKEVKEGASAEEPKATSGVKREEKPETTGKADSAIKPNPEFDESTKDVRKEKAKEFFGKFSGADWVEVQVHGKVVAGDRGFKAKNPEELVSNCTIEELDAIGKAVLKGRKKE